MLRSHSRANDIGVGVKSVAYWSTQATGVLLVFVHGFASGAVACWAEFPQLLQSERKVRGADLVFFGYDSLFNKIGANAQELFGLLDVLATNPGSFINPLVAASEARGSGFRYRRIVIVAHSLGAVVSRRALLNAHGKGRTWQGTCSLVLFAPAHMGAKSGALALGAVGLIPTVGSALALLTQHTIPTLGELEPGSATLTELLEDSKRLLAAGHADHLKARAVMFGFHERVVETTRFAEDPDPPEFIPKKGHTDVQRASGAFRLPVQRVLGTL